MGESVDLDNNLQATVPPILPPPTHPCEAWFWEGLVSDAHVPEFPKDRTRRRMTRLTTRWSERAIFLGDKSFTKVAHRFKFFSR